MLPNQLDTPIKILVVEDEILVAEDIKDILEEFGYIVVAIADSGEEAIAKAAQLRPHLVLMDVRLKGLMDGIQAAETIWNSYQIPIIYLTANSDIGTLQRAKATDPFAYITKPFKEKELQTAVEIALHRHQLEQTLKDREQWLNTILSSLGDAVIATDENNRITLLNPVAETLTGWKQSEAFGKPTTEVFQLAHETTRQKIACPVTKALESGDIASIPEQTILIAKDGLEIPIDDSAAPIIGDYGNIKGAVVVFRDITERKRYRQRLETDRAIARIIAESNKIAIAIPQFLEAICLGLQWEVGEFWSIEQQTGVLRLVNSWHLPSPELFEFSEIAEQLFFSQGVGLPGWVWEVRKPIWISNLAQETNFLRTIIAERVGLRSAIGIPIFCEGKILGVMTLFNRKIQECDRDLVAMLNTIGTGIGQFIDRKNYEVALRKSQKHLAWQAKHDALTGLVNRREFERRLEVALNDAKTKEQQHSLCYLDLDRFKIVNDSCGHGAGDELLRQVTALLRSQVRTSDVLARLGGDEFGLLLVNCPPQQALAIANALRQSIQEFRFAWEDKTFTIGVSIGLVTLDAATFDLASAVNAADAACYVAKNTGRNRVHLYQSDRGEAAQQQGQIQWVSKLNQALEEDRFCLYYQPIVPVTQSELECDHYEVLLRLYDETGASISPMAFIPAAERYHLMQHIDRWVIRKLFSTQGQHYQECWNRSLETGDRCLYSINLSGASIADDRFIDFVREQFAIHQIPPQVICFEITETVAISNLAKAKKLIQELKNMGCRFALDDFGSGMSSFAYLRNLPIDYLKIDGGFIKDIVEDSTDLALTEAINNIGHVMGLQTIAEFVENDAILNKLKVLGVDYAQGYGIAKPRPL
ncbi:MAG: EAL domain-containing protein [Hydrococcus sp. Prado102]|jgi:diguanylate cyclase (GGDEF)-like protein/PAS domain S-box-containing protein|nr:EAL domain-containing protein [Hydrococcus sp. Prado102]